MAWIAPTNRIIPKPMTFHTTDAVMARLDRSASTPSHSTGLDISPRSSRIRFTRPKSVLNSQYQSRFDTPRPITTGMNTTVRVILRSGVFCAVSRASRYPPTISSGVMIAVYLRVNTKDTQNWVSENARL